MRTQSATSHPTDDRCDPAMIAVQGAETLDWHYLMQWAARLGITDQLGLIRPK